LILTGVFHCDLKPENILLAEPYYSSINIQGDIYPILVPNTSYVKIVDFGTAVHISQDRPAIVVSRSYRPVEVVLGIGWDQTVDIWSIGCIIMELFTGRRLFNVSNGTDQEHLQLMEALLGPIPQTLLNAPVIYSQTAAKYVKNNNNSISLYYNISPLSSLSQTDA
jgi:serine/threonine protein kinase